MCALLPPLSRGGEQRQRLPSDRESGGSPPNEGNAHPVHEDLPTPLHTGSQGGSHTHRFRSKDPTSLHAVRIQATELCEAWGRAAEVSITPVAVTVGQPCLARVALAALSRPTVPSSAVFGRI